MNNPVLLVDPLGLQDMLPTEFDDFTLPMQTEEKAQEAIQRQQELKDEMEVIEPDPEPDAPWRDPDWFEKHQREEPPSRPDDPGASGMGGGGSCDLDDKTPTNSGK